MNLNPVGWASSSLRLVAKLFNSGVNSTTPVTAISEAPIGFTNADIALVAKGTGATLAQVPDGTAVGGDKRGQYATDWQKFRSSLSQVASGQYATIGGGRNNVASSTWSVVGGGYGNSAFNNAGTTIGGGNFNSASGSFATVLGGGSNSATGNYSIIGGGLNNSASSDWSYVSGGRRGTTRFIIGNHVFPACSSPIADTGGVTQSALLLLARQTTNATATVLTSDGYAATTFNQVILPNNSAYSFSGEVIAGVTGGGDTARWTINGAIKRGANAASTAIVGTATVTMTHNDAGAAGWTVAVTADTTNGGIAVTVTGAASTTIRWVCKINTTEMTY